MATAALTPYETDLRDGDRQYGTNGFMLSTCVRLTSETLREITEYYSTTLQSDIARSSLAATFEPSPVHTRVIAGLESALKDTMTSRALRDAVVLTCVAEHASDIAPVVASIAYETAINRTIVASGRELKSWHKGDADRPMITGTADNVLYIDPSYVCARGPMAGNSVNKEMRHFGPKSNNHAAGLMLPVIGLDSSGHLVFDTDVLDVPLEDAVARAIGPIRAKLSYVDARIKRDKPFTVIGAIWIECVVAEFCSHDILAAHPAFIAALARLCEKHGVALVFDDSYAGCGRTGVMWTFQHYAEEFAPDFVIFGKHAGTSGLMQIRRPTTDVVRTTIGYVSFTSMFGSVPHIMHATKLINHAHTTLANVQAIDEHMRAAFQRLVEENDDLIFSGAGCLWACDSHKVWMRRAHCFRITLPMDADPDELVRVLFDHNAFVVRVHSSRCLLCDKDCSADDVGVKRCAGCPVVAHSACLSSGVGVNFHAWKGNVCFECTPFHEARLVIAEEIFKDPSAPAQTRRDAHAEAQKIKADLCQV